LQLRTLQEGAQDLKGVEKEMAFKMYISEKQAEYVAGGPEELEKHRKAVLSFPPYAYLLKDFGNGIILGRDPMARNSNENYLLIDQKETDDTRLKKLLEGPPRP